MPRSLKKTPHIQPALYKSVKKAKAEGSSRPIQTKSRSSMIIPDMVGLVIQVHNGKEFVPALIAESMVGHKLGDFAMTRKFTGHAGNKKTK